MSAFLLQQGAFRSAIRDALSRLSHEQSSLALKELQSRGVCHIPVCRPPSLPWPAPVASIKDGNGRGQLPL